MPHHFVVKLTEGGGPSPSDELRHLIDEARSTPDSTAWLGTKKPGRAWRPIPAPFSSIVLTIHVQSNDRVAAVLAKIVGRRSIEPGIASVRDFYGVFGPSMNSWWELSKPLALTFPSLDAIPGLSTKGRRAKETFRGQSSFAYWDFDAYDMIVDRATGPVDSTSKEWGEQFIDQMVRWMPESGLPDFLQLDAYGEVLLKGHRITLFNVLDLHQAGADSAAIGEEFPTLSGAMIEQTLEYFRANRADLGRYLDRYRALLDWQEACNRGGPGLAELTRRAVSRRNSVVL